MADSDTGRLLQTVLPAGEVLRFAVVGIAATLTHFTALTLGVEAAGLAPTPANGLAFCTAVLVTYLGQSLWVFRVSGHGLMQIQKFLVSAVTGFVSNIALMAAIVQGLGLHYYVGFAAVTTIVPFGTFLANKFWVFAQQRDRHDDRSD
jgi:putative flippase GtrA